MKDALISIIVPVYNAGQYLEQCVSSLRKQIYRNIEIILVDDGSLDGSGELCEAFSREDSRVRVFHQSNQGVSAARNLGLENACGNWILFVDADDWLNADACGRALLKIEETGADICGFNLFKEIAGKKAEIQRVFSQSILLENEKLRALVESLLHKNIDAAPADLKTMSGYSFLQALLGPYCKLFRRECIGTIRFPKGIQYAEDTFFVLQVIAQAEKIFWLDTPFYHYRWVSSSLINVFDRKRIENCVSLDTMTLDFIQSRWGDDRSLIASFHYGCFQRIIKVFHFYVRKTKIADVRQVCRNLKEFIANPVYSAALNDPLVSFRKKSNRLQLRLLRKGAVYQLYWLVRLNHWFRCLLNR